MIDKIKTLGLALVAIAALGAVVASAAQAGSIDIGATATGSAVLTGHSESEPTLTTKSTTKGDFPVKCPTAKFEGTVSTGKIEEATVTATYGENAEKKQCQGYGVKAQVIMHGCKFTITGQGQAANTANVDVVCKKNAAEPEKGGTDLEITIITGVCVARIPEQTALAHLKATQLAVEGGKAKITVEANVAGIEVTQLSATCPDGANHKAKIGSYTGNAIVEAFKDNGIQKVTEHSHQFFKNSCGEMVSLETT